jgi:hypothetical protein
MATKKEKVRCGVIDGSGGTNIENVVCGVKCFDPKLRRERGLDKESADDIISGTQHPFGLSILR